MQVVAVAASGGRDSTALLHCTARLGSVLGVRVVALHVHHGLMPQATVWQQQVHAQARRWGAGFQFRQLQGQPQPGESVEAWARRERYAALASMAREAGAALVLLAHHRRDQAETWFLQALRGGGPRGLSAMPNLAQRGGLTWARPWLGMPREAIDAYVQHHRLRCAEDASNADPRFARSRLRTTVWPALLAGFSDAEAALAAAAQHAQEAAALAAEVAAADLPLVSGGPGLHVQAWLALSPARRLNVLRAWLAATLGQGAAESLVQRLAMELPQARAACWPASAGRELRLYRGALALGAVAPARVAPRSALTKRPAANAEVPTEPPLHDFSSVGRYALPAWGATLCVTEVTDGGIAVDLLKAVCLRQRAGSERFQLHPAGPPRSLKLQFQAKAVPAWERHGPLLVAAEGPLLFVPGLGADARCLAPAGMPQRQLQWLPAVVS